MQLAGDARALVGDRLPCPQFSLALSLDQPRSHRVAADPDDGGDTEKDQRRLRGVAASGGEGQVGDDFRDPDG